MGDALAFGPTGTTTNIRHRTSQYPICEVNHMQSKIVRIILVCCLSLPIWPRSVDIEWQARVDKIRWVAYSPSQGNPQPGGEPAKSVIEEDLRVLRTAGFTGLVTYGSAGVLGASLPSIAQAAGFNAVIVGVW